MNTVQFFYDNQIRRFLVQFIRMVSGFQVQFGTADSTTGALALQSVPVYYGDPSRQASQILRGGSDNTMQTVPAMAVYISSLNFDQSRLQDPFLVTNIKVRERRVDPNTGMLTDQEGDAFNVERPMPMPYKIGLKLDIWTSNTEQKLQIIEQIATLFTPSLEIQSTDNYVDWTSLSAVLLTDINWDSRTIPTGTDDTISVATMTFELPIWISPPAKVTKLGVIQRIISNVYDATEGNLISGGVNGADALDGLIMSRRFTSVMNYGVYYQGNMLSLMRQSDFLDHAGNLRRDPKADYTWPTFINEYGAVRAGFSEVRLITDEDVEIVGTIAIHPTDPTLLLFEPFSDTLPQNTIRAVEAIVDPYKLDQDRYRNNLNVRHLLFDAQGNYNVSTGTRYLITEDIDTVAGLGTATAWAPNNHPFIAHAGDIIEFDGTKWNVSFDCRNNSNKQYVTNMTTGIQYKWNGETWVKSTEGVYPAGKWVLVL